MSRAASRASVARVERRVGRHRTRVAASRRRIETRATPIATYFSEAVEAGVIIFAARVLALGLGKAKQSGDLERGLEECARRSIDVSDLFYEEDQGEQRWYLVGGWSVPRKGDPRYGDGRMSQEVKSRVRWADCRAMADARGVDYDDVATLTALYPTTTKKALELRRRLQMAGYEPEWWE
ncbi:hypothetical protein BE221DRAFT_72011 [Ostreococcus tauri]|uniref:Uncharacterized protein n=1 Tax=Ostreococcus tauri TaxID=70448 RepID=A0A1Y5ICT2_OSTTA|nr:hypothetical protein BE221DRAFT_72011 [Ostreococcus tauri]